MFGLRKSRQRHPSLSGQDLGERSVPYDQLATPIRPPIPVATPTQGLRGISAPSTNPSLTDDGTELNLYTMEKQKRAYDQPPIKRPASSTNSTLSTADSSTLFEESDFPIPSSRYAGPHVGRTHRIEQFTSNRSPNAADFGQYPPNDSSSNSSRPASALTSKSDSNRSSRYAPSTSTIESSSHHTSLSQLYHRSHWGETFHFPRPESDAEIEALFDDLKRMRDFPVMPSNMSIDQKWHLVYNAEHIRWSKAKQKEEQSKRHKDSGQSNAPLTDSPEWYLKKFVERTITSKQVQSLGVSLRSNEMRCVSMSYPSNVN